MRVKENITQQNGTIKNSAISTIFSQYWLFTVVVCSILSLIGNTLLILIVYRNKRLHTTPNYIIVNMAVSDLFTPLYAYFLFPNVVAAISRNSSANFLSFMCKVGYFLTNVSNKVSMISLVIITVHRFCAVVCPLKARLKRKRLNVVLLLGTWIVPIVAYLIMLEPVLFKVDILMCQPIRWLYMFYIFCFDMIIVVSSFAIILVMYPVILVKLVTEPMPDSFKSYAAQRRQHNVNLTKMFVMMIVVFTMTVCNFQVSKLILWISKPNDFRDLLMYNFIVAPFPCIFHAINPAICFAFSSFYRRGIKQIFSCCRGAAVGNHFFL